MGGRFAAHEGRITGAGRRLLVLSHGFGTDQDAWHGIRPWADAHFRTLSYNLAGAGPGGAATYDPRRHASLYGYVDDLLDLLDEQAVERCIFVGHSVSGVIGLAAAVARPALFSRLVLIGASARYLNDGAYAGGFDQSDLDGLYAGMAANYQAWCAGFAPAVVGVPDGEAIADFSRSLFAMRPDIALATSRTIFQSDMRALVPRLERPAHLIQTREDLAVPLGAAEWLQRNIPDATLDVIEARGHLPHMTAPANVVAVLARHLAGTGD
ncbi:alpha/beta fold hydrolase [Zavarzinia compransoris]|uniref:alpha/beta fold hydrolase n=1 Tax=Zavarzinia compransoris TaxID=1264899 RepID=UPI0010D8A6E7|nr:alpha/beta hydrolase [Zavarzinia compransoris]TDP47294.1 sigma-B regulation protein RsbQ [Zavarzinia compransoris]